MLSRLFTNTFKHSPHVCIYLSLKIQPGLNRDMYLPCPEMEESLFSIRINIIAVCSCELNTFLCSCTPEFLLKADGRKTKEEVMESAKSITACIKARDTCFSEWDLGYLCVHDITFQSALLLFFLICVFVW